MLCKLLQLGLSIATRDLSFPASPISRLGALGRVRIVDLISSALIHNLCARGNGVEGAKAISPACNVRRPKELRSKLKHYDRWK